MYSVGIVVGKKIGLRSSDQQLFVFPLGDPLSVHRRRVGLEVAELLLLLGVQPPLTTSLLWRLVEAAFLVGYSPVPSQTGWHTESFNVKRLLLPPLLRLIPAAQATDDVKCEAMNKAYGRLTIGLLASAIALAPLPTKAQVATSENIAEKLSSAFGNQDLFDSIAVEFVDKANASFSCKWWVMKANHQHQLDFRSLQTTPQEVHQHIMGQMQGNMVEFTFPAINKACTD